MKQQSEVLSSLVGRKARITMSREGEELERGLKDKEKGTGVYHGGASSDCWRYLGEYGEVTAVWKNGDHDLMVALLMEPNGKVVELYAKHLHIGGMVNDKK